MSVAVYPRLAQLLEDKHLTVAELERQIKQQYGLSVNSKTLYRLTQSTPVQRADLEIAGAAAAVLGVGLDDLFTVDAVSINDETESPILGLVDSRRMATLIDRQAHYLLTELEWTELTELVAKYGQILHERRLRERARARGISLDQERQETESHLAQALNEWHTDDIEAHQNALVEQAMDQQALGFNVGEISGPLGTRHDSILDGHYPPSWIASHRP